MDNHHHNLKRVYFPEGIAEKQLVSVEGAKAHHLYNVCRLSAGNQIRIFNHINGEWLAEIRDINKKNMSLEIIAQLRKPFNKVDVALLFSPIKAEKMQFLLEKAVEIGVTHLVPAIMERSIVKNSNHEKTIQYILQATEQCERLDLPQLDQEQKLEQVVHKFSEWQIIFCNETELAVGLKQCLSSLTAKKIAILVGPEGGFTPREKEFLSHQQHVTSVHLGANIMRTETAALYAASCVQFFLQNDNFSPRVGNLLEVL